MWSENRKLTDTFWSDGIIFIQENILKMSRNVIIIFKKSSFFQRRNKKPATSPAPPFSHIKGETGMEGTVKINYALCEKFHKITVYFGDYPRM